MEQSKLQKILEQRAKKKMIFTIQWGVHPLRTDKRTGVINPGYRDPYTTYLMKEIEDQFKK